MFRFVQPFVRRIRGLTQTNCLAKETVGHTSGRDSGMDMYGAHVDEDSTSDRKLYVRLGGHVVISLTVFFFLRTFPQYVPPIPAALQRFLFLTDSKQSGELNNESAKPYRGYIFVSQCADGPDDIFFRILFIVATGEILRTRACDFLLFLKLRSAIGRRNILQTDYIF